MVIVSPTFAKRIKIATISPDGTTWMNEMRAGAKEIKEKTEGRVVFKFYPGGVMGSDESVLRKIRINQLQGGAVTASSMVSIYPDMSIYGLPYLFSSLDEVDYVRSKLDAELIANLEEKGFVTFGLAEGGFAYMMSDKALHSVADVREQKVWIPSSSKIGEAVFNSADISPVPLPLSDVLTGLQTGLINTVITSPIGAIALQWHTKIGYVIDIPLTYFSAILVVEKKAFNKLKKQDQEIVRNVMTAVYKRIDLQNRKDNIAAKAALKNQGIQFVKLSEKSEEEWFGIGAKAMKKLENDNNYSSKVYDGLMKYLEDYRKSQK
jgi:TRAP-type C4-dicarboxylate transport system substrate-binding protein